MQAIRRTAVLAAVTAIFTYVSTPAPAHPHIFAEANLEIGVDGDRTVGSLRHVWRFDDLFSSTVLLEFDMNSDLKLDDTELEEVASVVHASLAEYDYFQLLTVKGKDVAMRPPERLMANFEDNQLIILFESQPEQPLTLDEGVDFGVYDPSFYTAIEFLEDENMVVNGMPDDCTRSVVRPDPDEAIAANQSTLTDAFFNDPGGNDLSKIFATRLQLTCEAKG